MKRFSSFSLLIVALACGSGSKGEFPEPGAACYRGLTERVQKECGCGAAQREVEVALAQTQLNDLVRSDVMTCLNGKLSLDVVSKSIISGAVDGCVRQQQTLDPAVRDQVIAIVSNAVERSNRSFDEQRIWVDCYAEAMSKPKPPPTLASKNAEAPLELRSKLDPVEPPQERSGKKLYDWKIWVANIDPLMPDLDEVYYSFDHPSFEGSVAHSSKADRSFQVQYRGWGCVDKVTATLVFKDGSWSPRTAIGSALRAVTYVGDAELRQRSHFRA